MSQSSNDFHFILPLPLKAHPARSGLCLKRNKASAKKHQRIKILLLLVKTEITSKLKRSLPEPSRSPFWSGVTEYRRRCLLERTSLVSQKNHKSQIIIKILTNIIIVNNHGYLSLDLLLLSGGKRKFLAERNLDRVKNDFSVFNATPIVFILSS